MALVVSHPDYMSFEGEERRPYTYPAEFHREFLKYIVSYIIIGYF
jgi:hypothetical protein